MVSYLSLSKIHKWRQLKYYNGHIDFHIRKVYKVESYGIYTDCSKAKVNWLQSECSLVFYSSFIYCLIE